MKASRKRLLKAKIKIWRNVQPRQGSRLFLPRARYYKGGEGGVSTSRDTMKIS